MEDDKTIDFTFLSYLSRMLHLEAQIDCHRFSSWGLVWFAFDALHPYWEEIAVIF